MGFMKPKTRTPSNAAAKDLEAEKKAAAAAEKKRRALLFGTEGGEAGQLLPQQTRNTLLGN